MQDIYFHLPGLFEHFGLYQLVMFFYNTERDRFYDWVNIGSIYGSPYGAYWNGGRIKGGVEPLHEDIVVQFAKEYNFSCRFTFTNPHIDERYINDNFCNMILDKFNWEGHQNQVIVNSPILEQHIRENHPSYQLISSTTKCITNNNEALAEIDKDYIMTVIDYNYNKDFEFLKSIKNPEKVELLINPVCYPKCPRRKEHYNVIGLSSLHVSGLAPFECDAQGKLFYEAMKNPLFISIDDIQNIYAPLGFKNFKIEGRTAPYEDLVEILAYYLIKPEYQIEMRQKFLHATLS